MSVSSHVGEKQQFFPTSVNLGNHFITLYLIFSQVYNEEDNNSYFIDCEYQVTKYM